MQLSTPKHLILAALLAASLGAAAEARTGSTGSTGSVSAGGGGGGTSTHDSSESDQRFAGRPPTHQKMSAKEFLDWCASWKGGVSTEANGDYRCNDANGNAFFTQNNSPQDDCSNCGND